MPGRRVDAAPHLGFDLGLGCVFSNLVASTLPIATARPLRDLP